MLYRRNFKKRRKKSIFQKCTLAHRFKTVDESKDSHRLTSNAFIILFVSLKWIFRGRRVEQNKMVRYTLSRWTPATLTCWPFTPAVSIDRFRGARPFPVPSCNGRVFAITNSSERKPTHGTSSVMCSISMGKLAPIVQRNCVWTIFAVSTKNGACIFCEQFYRKL